ncbi:MAG: winged helix-turn-helix domain-containing protein, partial [Burkholderiaceae bacterium]
MNEPVLRFERFELQLAERRLFRDGEEVPMRSRTFDLLVVLAERAGQLVTKDELLDLVWPGLVVEENNIATQVAALRKALASELIVTVPGRGYRFAARPQAGADAAPPVAAPIAPAVPRRPTLFGRDADLARLRRALERPGCVSLVGPGGVGKTALANRLAAEAGGEGQAVWVDLSALSGGEQLLPALCRALGLEPGEAD